MCNEFSFCIYCGKKVEYTVKESTVIETFHGTECTYKAKTAYCKSCGKEISTASIDDYNLSALYESFRLQNNIVSLEKIKQIPKLYNIGKRPLSKVLGLGEATFTRYLEGNIPSKSNSQLLEKVFKDPYFYNELLEQNKNEIPVIAYRKSKNAVEQQIQPQSNSKIENVCNYIIAKCSDITPLALQKALYYIQGFYYAFNKSFMFSENCEAWLHGPVYRDVYEKYKEYKCNPLEPEKEIHTAEFSAEEKSILDAVINDFCCYNGKILEEFTHSEKPWLTARKGIEADKPSNVIIQKEWIADFFTEICEQNNISRPEEIQRYSRSRFEMLRNY